MVRRTLSPAIAACLVASLAGCFGGDGLETGRSDFNPGQAPALKAEDAEKSAVIQALLSRQSILKSGTSYDKVAKAVLAANSRAAEAELQAARLRAVAAEKNWLPTLGPRLSLSSMGDFIGQILVEQVLFDNGRKKAERVFTAADVEVTAVALAEDTNERVFTALSLYITAEQARADAQVTRRALDRMKHFEWIMSERVNGGVSDQSELSVLQHKRAELEADLSAQQQTAATALAELNAMAASPVTDITGLSRIAPEAAGRKPLAVLRSEAERTRDIAGAKIERAGYLPGLKASGTLGNGAGGPDLSATTDQGLGFNTGAKLKAIKAAEEAASRRVDQAQEDAARERANLDASLRALAARKGEQARVTGEAQRTYSLFQNQYDEGQRSVMEVVSVFENFIAAERKEVGITYQAARTRLQIGRHLGLLVDGAKI